MVLSILLITDNTAIHIGSGFVTNKRGLFITAAHVINNHLHELERIRVTFPELEQNCKLYKVKLLYKEYLDPIYIPENEIKKIRPYHQDLAICRVLGCKDIGYYKIATKRPSIDDLLTVKGFYSSGQREIIDGKVDLSLIARENVTLRIKHRLIAIISKSDNDYEKNIDIVDSKKKFNNCLTLRNSVHKGVSGGPVLNSANKVVGFFIGGKASLNYCNVVCAKYFRKRYRLILDQ